MENNNANQNDDSKQSETPGIVEPPPRPRNLRPDDLVVAKRINEVLQFRLDGAQYHDIENHSEEQGWHLSRDQLREYMSRADKIIMERMEKSREKRIALHVARRESLLLRCVNGADFSNARGILADLARLEGLYPDKKVIIEDARKRIAEEMTDEELQKVIAQAEKQNGTTESAGSAGTTETAASAGEPDGLHPIYEAGLPDQLAPQSDSPQT